MLRVPSVENLIRTITRCVSRQNLPREITLDTNCTNQTTFTKLLLYYQFFFLGKYSIMLRTMHNKLKTVNSHSHDESYFLRA